MNNSGLQLDTKDFDLKFKEVVTQAIPGLAEKGFFEAMTEALHDADYEKPYLPLGPSGGDLRGSKKINKVNRTSGEISIIGGFNSAYAKRWHEISPDNIHIKDKLGRPLSKHWPINWTRPGSGPKFLESKLIRNRNKYMKIVAERIRRGQK